MIDMEKFTSFLYFDDFIESESSMEEPFHVFLHQLVMVYTHREDLNIKPVFDKILDSVNIRKSLVSKNDFFCYLDKCRENKSVEENSFRKFANGNLMEEICLILLFFLEYIRNFYLFFPIYSFILVLF